MESSSNPLFVPSALPYQLSPFAEIADEHIRLAFLRGFDEQLAEVSVSNPDEPSFEKTMIPLERSGQLLARVSAALTAD